MMDTNTPTRNECGDNERAGFQVIRYDGVVDGNERLRAADANGVRAAW
jgi:hypothetical protein